jgi:two-component system, LytTR family, response regulator
MIKALVVDDEVESRKFLAQVLIKLFPDVQASSVGTVKEALSFIEEKKPDVVFLDILMDGESGFDIFPALTQCNFETIFTTAHNEFAIKAFKFSALDYLLKPIDLDDLESAVNKLRKRLVEKSSTSATQISNLIDSIRNPSKPLDKLAIPSSNGFVLVPLMDIVYCESDGNYTNFFILNGKKITSSYTLKQYDEMLTTQNFFRAHKSFLVNIAHITRYIKGEGGTLVMANGMEIEVSRRNKEELIKILKAS